MSRTSLFLRFLPVALGVFALAAVATAQEEGCGDCHDVAFGKTAVHADFGCLGCHMEYDEGLHPEEMTADEELCGQCHDVGDTLAESVHAAIGCQDCHGPVHEIPAAADPASPVSPLLQIASCGACHNGEIAWSVENCAMCHSGIPGTPTHFHGSTLQRLIAPAYKPLDPKETAGVKYENK